jgi:hypothetical protein
MITGLLCNYHEYAPWLSSYFKISEQFPLYKFLIALACGSDSLLIFCEVQKFSQIDLNSLLYEDGNNLMHICCENGAIMVLKWLLNNGFECLLQKQRDDGKTPLHVAINSVLFQAEDIVRYIAYRFEKSKGWIEIAKKSENKQIVSFAKEEEYYLRVKAIRDVSYLQSVSLEEIEAIFTHWIFINDICFSPKKIAEFFKSILLPSNRIDLFNLFIDFLEERNFNFLQALQEVRAVILEDPSKPSVSFFSKKLIILNQFILSCLN